MIGLCYLLGASLVASLVAWRVDVFRGSRLFRDVVLITAARDSLVSAVRTLENQNEKLRKAYNDAIKKGVAANTQLAGTSSVSAVDVLRIQLLDPFETTDVRNGEASLPDAEIASSSVDRP